MTIRGGAAAGAAAAVLVLGTAGCGSPGAAHRDTAAGDGLDVVTGFYPLQYVTGRIAGDRAHVTGLTPPGAEPHDLELAARDVAAVSDADLVVHLGGFQPSVDQAVRQQAADRSFDVAPSADLDLESAAHEDDPQEGAGNGGREDRGRDPHFWLDPRRLSAVGAGISGRLASLDPDGAPSYAANLAALQEDLAALDEDLEQGTASCTSKDLVTSHRAFGYFARRYGFREVAVTGLSPEQEPDAASLARTAAFVREHRVRTVYTETLASPATARTVAAETGATVAVLDPVEGLSGDSDGSDYLSVMRANLASIRTGQPCP